jgi:hypothetical protein
MMIQVASSLLVSGVLLMALVPALKRWWQGALVDRDRFILVAFAILAANCVLGFAYVKDEVLSVAAVFYAGGVFAALATLADRLRDATTPDWRPVAGAVVLVCASVLWASRAAATFFSLESSAYKVINDWAGYSLERELPADWGYEPTRRAFLELQRRNMSVDVPHPALTEQSQVDEYLEVQ